MIRLASRRTCALLVITRITLAGTGAAQDSAATDVPQSVRRFLARTDQPVVSYRALRRLEAHNPRYKKHGWLEAWTTLSPESGFTFEIVGEGGSSYVRNHVLRKALERERDAHRRAEPRRAAIAPDNYDFGGEVSDDDGLVTVELKPRRKDPLLVAGRAYLRPEDGDLVRIEGYLAKNPSIWTKRVHLVRSYGRIEQIRVLVAMESVAQIVVAGESSFTMVYEYASINGIEVGDPHPRVITELQTVR